MVKCLLTWSWEGKDGVEVNKRFRNWKPVGDVKMYFPIHTLVGQNKAFTVSEVENIETLVRNTHVWTDICKFEIAPCIDSRELMKIDLKPIS